MNDSGENFFAFKGLTIFFKHTDYYGLIHPYNFFEWTSYIRESFFQTTLPNFQQILERPIKMMTVKISCEIHSNAQFGDVLEARLTVGKIKKVSFDMLISFFDAATQKKVAATAHTVVFVDSQTERFADIPAEMQNVIVNYHGQV
jgi:YbgC/YbaW family acyl-CoA thioester hydrolase